MSVTREMLEAAFEAIESHEPQPHYCIVHPKGGLCLECGQPWRLADGRMERPSVFGREAECNLCGQTFPHYHRDTLDGEEIVRLSSPPSGREAG